jgi:ABC-type dipeptide/oligopeptide/nickel transport system permease subunit
MTGRGGTRKAALAFLVLLYALSLGAGRLAPWPYEKQFRDSPAASPCRQFPLGTDELGRDRLSRLLAGSRISLWMAPAASLLAVAAAALAGGWAALAGGWLRFILLAAADLTLCVPAFFLLLMARAVLPLDVDPYVSVAATFMLLGVLGWAGPARVVSKAAEAILQSHYVVAARARGVPAWRILVCHAAPNLRPVLSAQFWTYIPVFLLAEANLGMLGLGVTEPLPSWGGLLKELESVVASGGGLWTRPWMLAPLAVLVAAVAASSVLAATEEAA